MLPSFSDPRGGLVRLVATAATSLATLHFASCLASCDPAYPCTVKRASGRIISARDGAPLEGAVVTSNDPAGNVRFTRTDAMGRFSLALPAPPNTCEVGGLSVEKTGCETFRDESHADVPDRSVALPCAARCVGSRTVRGIVRGTDGAPMRGAHVNACRTGASSCALVQTDADGRFSTRVDTTLEAGVCRVAPLFFAHRDCSAYAVTEFRGWAAYDAELGDVPIDVDLTLDIAGGCDAVRVAPAR